LVLAGTNGAGKSSIGGAFLRQAGGRYLNPDEIARAMRVADPSLDVAAANGRAWAPVGLLRRYPERHDFALETTLGGRTITGLLLEALGRGFEVRVWYAGLATPELHVARVATRVHRGGHDIPEPDIRRRYDESRRNLVVLLPHLTELAVYDNSAEGDPPLGKTPRPVLVLQLRQGAIVGPPSVARTPAWARPIVAAARRLAPRTVVE
jgi:predicted ABC-type ATPase